MTLLTKTLFVMGTRCPKLLYYSANKKEDIPSDSLGVEFRKKQGTYVGEIAKRLFPEGMDFANLSDVAKLELTENNKDKILFEASVQFEDLFARADILKPNADGSFDIIEVKSDTEIKPEHIPDVAFQKFVFEKCGYKISNCILMHVNNEYVKQGDLDVNTLFVQENVNEQVNEYLVDIDEKINSQLEVLRSETIPVANICQSCIKPYECSLKSLCWSHLEKNNVTQLFYGKQIGFDLLEQDITLIKDIPEGTKLKLRPREQAIQIKATKENKTHINMDEVKAFVDSINYPIYYFDFETYAPAIPVFDNSRPWQQVPFQFSLHIEQEDGSIEHKEFLATDSKDPRPELMNAMKEMLGTKGDILVYNKKFEKGRIEELARDFPEFQEYANNYLSRLVDLAFLFEKFHYYNPEQQGKYSIKAVLPIFTDLSYKTLAVSNGEEAFVTYKKIAFENAENKEELITALKEYCKLDTWAEVELLRGLKELISN